MRPRFFTGLLKRLAALEAAVADVDRRQNNMLREAVVTDVFHDDGLYVVDANGVKSKKVPVMARSGDVRDWNPPTKGERVLLISPTGEPGVGMILPGGYTDGYPQPHNKGGEARRTIGGYSITESGNGLHIEVGGVTVSITGDGLSVTGGRVEHDGRNIGSDHKHLDVTPGGGKTGVPDQ